MDDDEITERLRHLGEGTETPAHVWKRRLRVYFCAECHQQIEVGREEEFWHIAPELNYSSWNPSGHEAIRGTEAFFDYDPTTGLATLLTEE